MLAVLLDQPGGPEQLRLGQRPDPEPGVGEVVIDVVATAVNRADVMQRQGRYDPPPGASDIIGLECSGVISVIGTEVSQWSVGEEVCALLAGGGYASRVAVPAAQVLPLPAGTGLIEAGALPEVACTVWSNLVTVARLRAGETVLVHGGGSGIGTMAIQVARALGARVAVTAARPATLDRCRELGADILINHTEDDFVESVRTATNGRGADVILDVVGAKYLSRNLSALAKDGRLVIIGVSGGTRAELDLGALLRTRASISATSLRARPINGPGSKGEIVAQVRANLWPMIADGRVRPIVDSVLPLAQAADAHRRMEAGGHVGKIVLRVR